MSTNPNNAVGTNGAFGGRTSVNAFNDGIAAYTSGVLSGWGCSPSSGLTVVLGGDGNTRDVAIAEDNSGNKTTINNISGTPISVTVGNAPSTNSRIDSIVAYVDNPPTGSSTVTDNYEACGLIVVPGSVASSPVAPNESAIRSAITADGASGTTAYFVVLANVTTPSGTTDLTSDNIQQGSHSGEMSGSFSLTEIDTGARWIDGKTIYKKTINFGSLPNSTTKEVPHNISNLAYIVEMRGITYNGTRYADLSAPGINDPGRGIQITATATNVIVTTGFDRTNDSAYITLYYTKNS